MVHVRKRKGSPYWQITYRDVHGERQRISSGTTDHDAAFAKGLALERPWKLAQEGLLSPQEALALQESSKPLGQHLEDFLEGLRLAERDPASIGNYRTQIAWMTSAVGAKKLGDFNATAVQRALVRLKEEGRAASTRNHYLQSLKAFMGWAVRMGRLANHPLDALTKADERSDRRRERRALVAAEIDRLFAHADPRGRGLFYRLAFLAGLRRGDIQRLAWQDISLEGGYLAVRHGKSRRVDPVPLHFELREWLEREPQHLPTARVVPRMVSNNTRQRDFVAAGIELVVSGLHADLHSLRSTLNHELANADVPEHLRGLILRHAPRGTTDRHYSCFADLRFTPGLKAAQEAINRIRKPVDEAHSERTGSDDERKS